MIKMLSYKVTILLLIVSMLTSVLACGSGGSSSPTPDNNPEKTSSATVGKLESAQAQQIAAIGQSNTEEERKPAIEEVVRQGFTLGLVDENGNQLNPNVPADSLSLTPEDVAAHAAMIPGGNYRTINYVVDSLAEAGVVLASTEEVITLEDFLPDLQDYVDRSFTNPDAPQSSLGLLIGSGYELEVPNSAPTIDGETMISPLASLMMIADILLGIEESPSQNEDDVISKILSVFTDDAYADDKKDIVSEVKGHITFIKEIIPKEQAKNIVASIEFNDRLVIRVGDKNSRQIFLEKKEFASTNRLFFTKASNSQLVTAFIFDLIENDEKAAVEPLTSIATEFTLALISPVDIVVDDKNLWTTLFADADAELTGSGDYTIDQNSHLINYKPSSNGYVYSTITATQFPSEVSRAALLLVSAKIEFDPQIYMPLAYAVKILGETIKSDDPVKYLHPAPWVCAVILEKAEDVICGKESDSDGKVYWEGCTLNNQNHGKCRYYYEDGSLKSEGTYDNGKKDGFHTTYYLNPANKIDCEAEYEDDELIWKTCYSVDEQVLSEITRDGILKNYYWSGRIAKECYGTSDGEIECQRFCDNEAHTLCDEFMLDDYGYPINEGDGCDSMCSGNPPS